MSQDAKHRQSSKKRLDQLVYIELERGNGGMMLDISEESLSFRAIAPVESNTDIYFAFTIDGTRRLEGHGRLDWTEENGKVAGLEFTDVSREFRDAIQHWITRMGSPSRTPTIPKPLRAAPPSVSETFYRQPPLQEEKTRPVFSGRSAEPRHVKTPLVDKATVVTLTESWGTTGPSNSFEAPASNRIAPRPMVWDLPQELEENSGSRLSPAGWLSMVSVLVVVGVLLASSRQDVGRSLIALGKKISIGSQTAGVNSPDGMLSAPSQPTVPQGAPKEIVEDPQVNADRQDRKTNEDVSSERDSAELHPSTSGPLLTDRTTKSAARTTMRAPERVRNPAGEIPSLWAAVSQGSTGAEVTLARLYLVGAGVEKNCDQARVLLAAAAKKGNVEAVQKLTQLDREGCP